MNCKQNRVLFCCVIEPKIAWINAAVLLVRSIRQYGAAFASSPFLLIVNSDNDTTSNVSLIDEKQLYIIKQPRQIYPYSNKISALDAVDLFNFDYMVMLDHDTLVLNLSDLTDYLVQKVHARKNLKHGLRHGLGKNYIQAFTGLGLNSWKRVPYFNSGVVIVPRRYCKILNQCWMGWTNSLLSSFLGSVLIEQVGFGIAIHDAKIPYDYLPQKYNETNWKMPSGNAAIIHYNDYDPINITVKREMLNSYDRFYTFLNQSDNRFWNTYAERISLLLDSELTALSEEIGTLLNAR